MATAGSAERPGRPATSGKQRYGPVAGCGSVGSGSSPAENEAKKKKKCAEGHPACRLRRTQRRPGSGEERRSDPEKSSGTAGRRDRDNRRERFVSPALIPKCCDVLTGPTGKHKLVSEERDEVKRRKDESVRRDEEPVRPVLEIQLCEKVFAPFLISYFFACLEGLCSPFWFLQVGMSHSSSAGILLSSENSRSVSAPITADRRLAWRAVVSSSSTPVGVALPRPERSISPESNDSISEELNHFKPIVCSPCTPPKRLPDGRLLEPTIVKSTPRNLTRGLQRATSYEASPAVLLKWRQIELDRQSLKVNSKATLTSPVNELHNKTGTGGEDAKTRRSPLGRGGVRAANKRRLLFEPPAGDTDSFQKQSVKIRVPAIRYSSETTFRGSSDFEPAVGVPESGSGGALFSRKQSFSPYTKNSGFQSCKLVPKDSQSPRKESDSSLHNQSTSRRGKKREQKTKHLDSEQDLDLKRSRSASQEAFDERYVCQIQQERQDRAIALKLQRQFDRENQTTNRRRSPDKYFLRSWMSNQNHRRWRGLRRSRRINKKH
ncbi:E3 ubiquitin-protein ligase RNF169 [Anarrhichthys ocellatus]|uniref:E3 ubiquitin-protein ligase RNF169 n=1 Tax=Anarrhichthys ocellatus TaxID=433405 RepID=UPI0012EE1B92|nr:E3 ubiquitin-protein ligase RNF169 [Anarrhichthys ocellatus]